MTKRLPPHNTHVSAVSDSPTVHAAIAGARPKTALSLDQEASVFSGDMTLRAILYAILYEHPDRYTRDELIELSQGSRGRVFRIVQEIGEDEDGPGVERRTESGRIVIVPRVHLKPLPLYHARTPDELLRLLPPKATIEARTMGDTWALIEVVAGADRYRVLIDRDNDSESAPKLASGAT